MDILKLTEQYPLNEQSAKRILSPLHQLNCLKATNLRYLFKVMGKQSYMQPRL